jgi:multicomponent Na+:H+ antiporter subunit A
MAGVLPFFGFLAKELLYEEILHTEPWIMAAVIFGALVNVAVAALVAVKPFWRRPLETAEPPLKKAHEAPAAMRAGPLVLALTGLAAGIFSAQSGRLLAPAVSASAGQLVQVKLSLWHGLTPAFILSLATLAVGIGIFFLIRPIRKFMQQAYQLPGPEKCYQAAWSAGLNIAGKFTNLLQNGYLRYYLMIIIVSVVGGVSLTLFLKNGWHLPDKILEPRFYEIGLVLIILTAAFNATVSKSRLAAVASMGAIGFGIALIYLLYGAPDLAMTQFLIESLTVVLFVVAFYHLPRFSDFSTPLARVRDVFIALFAGSLMTMLVLSSIGGQLFPTISRYFAENSYTLGHGRNVVNVILVDFRGIDTMGEITVLGIAAIGVYALLKLRGKKEVREVEK